MAGFFMNTTVMCGRNMVSVCFLFLFVNFQLINGKPFFGVTMFCDLFCEDDDTPDDAARKSSPSSLEELFSSVWDPCSECPSSGSTNAATTPKIPTVAPAMQPPLNFMIPPSTGMNLTMIPFGNFWQMNFSPWSGPTGAASGAPGGPATTAPAATTAAATAAPAATTAAPAKPGATTAAAGATTAAPTTAKA